MFPKGLGNLGDLGGMMKQAMEMKERMEEIKAQLAEEEIEGAAGGGLVTAVVNGKFELLSLKIDPEIIDKENPETLEVMVRAAVNEALGKAQERMQERMREMTGGMDIPGITS